MDCLVFGHIFTICTYPFLEEDINWFFKILEKFPNLLFHNKRIFEDFFQDDVISNEKLKKSKVLLHFLGGKKTFFYSNIFGTKIVNTTALSVIKYVLKEDLNAGKINKKTRKKTGFKELKSLGFVKFKKF